MGDVQKTKLAAIEAEWETNLRLLPLLCSAFLIRKRRRTICDSDPLRTGHHCNAFRGYPVIGLKELMVQHEERIRNGMRRTLCSNNCVLVLPTRRFVTVQ